MSGNAMQDAEQADRYRADSLGGRFDGPDCGVDGCEREVGHTGDHAPHDSLDAAWAEAEAALPDAGWEITLTRSFYREGYVAYAAHSSLAPNHVAGGFAESAPFPGSHPIPAAALRALAAVLRERQP